MANIQFVNIPWRGETGFSELKPGQSEVFSTGILVPQLGDNISITATAHAEPGSLQEVYAVEVRDFHVVTNPLPGGLNVNFSVANVHPTSVVVNMTITICIITA
nr:hypothetical protein KPHV_40380 [Kitasatospora purpeofusca]